MKTNTTNKWLLTRIALPVTTLLILLSGCKNDDNTNQSGTQPDQDRVTFVVDSLLRENRKLTDSLTVVNSRLDDCEQARAQEKTTKPCPCKKKAQPTTPKKTQPAKPTTPKKTQPKKPTTPPAKSTVSATAKTSNTSATATTAQPVTQVVIGGNAQNNGAIITGNNNSVNNVVINGCTRVVMDTAANITRTRRVISAHAKSSYTYTK